jgi:hypothetical protein
LAGPSRVADRQHEATDEEMTRMTGSDQAGQTQQTDPARDQDTDTGRVETESSLPRTTPDGKVKYNPAEAGEYGVDPDSDKVYQPDDEDSDDDA